MIRVSSSATVSSIGLFLRESGYDVRHLGNELDLGNGLYANLENLDSLLSRTEGDSTIAVLARLFFVGWPVAETRCRIALPESFLNAALECGLLEKEKEKDSLNASACIFPFRSRLLACDSARTRVTLLDMVTGPSATTHYPARLALGGENETTLDLGTGCGALAIDAARYSRFVTGTDINPRCIKFAEFNAALNEVENIEWRCGDALEPVAGQSFSRIIANPPFFLSPSHTFVYCDSPLELDGFTARIATQAPAHLEEGGYFQMICEWVDLDQHPWEQRLRGWTSKSGCDTLILIAPRMTPIEYAEKRSNEARLMQTGAATHSLSTRLRYLTDRKVKHVIGGVITMRKRSGSSNWFAIVSTEPAGNDLGGDMRARFDALTFLATTDETQMLQTKLRLASDLILNRVSTPALDEWQTKSLELIKPVGLIDKLHLDETVSFFIPLFNGERRVCEIAAIVSEQLEISAEAAQQRCLQLARRLLQSNFVLLV